VALGRGWKPFLAYAVLLFLLAFLVLQHLPRGNLEVQKESVELFNADGDMGRRYPEWQAAVEMIREHPLLGVGSGCYQEKIGTFYGTIPIVPGSAAQADTQNLYLVLAASIGLPGLVAFLGLLLGAGAAAARKAVLAADTRSNGLFLGVAGSVAAFAVNSIWSPLLVRGIGIPLVFILALALAREDENSG
jgi:putative inorganic carbon (HCO3(-)) transporter